MKKTTELPPEETASTASQPSTSATLFLLFAKATGLAIGIALVMLIISGLIVGVYFYQKASQFSQYAGVSMSELKQLVRTSLSQKPTTIDGRKTLLLLGTDAVANRGNAPVLTDAIELVTINTITGNISLLSLPRDLWNDTYQTKINALLHYGIDRYPNNPAQFPTEIISKMTGVPIQHTMVIHLQNVADIITILGGVQITITHPFTDDQYPRDDVDISKVKDPALLYKTVQFEAGPQVLSAEQALEYMRSRHSEGDEGTDVSRAERQQELFGAVMAQLTSQETMLDVEKMGTLFAYYKKTFASSLSMEELGSIAVALAPHKDTLSLSRTSPSISTPEEEGVIYHPLPNRVQPQWIYAVTDRVAFQQFAQHSLDMPTTER